MRIEYLCAHVCMVHLADYRSGPMQIFALLTAPRQALTVITCLECILRLLTFFPLLAWFFIFFSLFLYRFCNVVVVWGKCFDVDRNS